MLENDNLARIPNATKAIKQKQFEVKQNKFRRKFESLRKETSSELYDCEVCEEVVRIKVDL